MTDTPEPTRPRPRRKLAAGEHAATPASHSTRVLLRLPRVMIASELPAPTAASSAAKTTPSVPPSSATASINITQAPISEKPVIEKVAVEKPAAALPSSASVPIHRVDAAHAAVPAPHTAAPAWLETKRSPWAALSQRKTLTAAGLILAVILGGSMLRGSKAPVEDKSNLTDAPKFSSVKREPKSSPRKLNDEPSTAEKGQSTASEAATDKAARSASAPRDDFSARPRRDAAGGPLLSEPRIGTSLSGGDASAANRPAVIDSTPPRTADLDYRPVARDAAPTNTPPQTSPYITTPRTELPPPGTVEYPVTPFDPIPAMPAFNPSRGNPDSTSSDINWARNNPGVRTALRDPAAVAPAATPRSELPGVARFEGSIGKPPANVAPNNYPR